MKSNVIVALLAGGACMASVACGSKSGNVEQTAVEEKPKVTTEVVHVEKVDQISVFTGNVEGYAVNNITPQSSRRISRLLVDVGDHVTAGQVVAEMDESSLAQAKSQLATDKAAFERADELYKFGGESKAAWEEAKNTYELSQSNYDNLLENTTLCSPIAGVVTARNYDNGDMVGAEPIFVIQQIRPVKIIVTEPIFVIQQIRPVKIIVNVSESLYSYVKKGMGVDVTLDALPDRTFEGKVSRITPAVDASTRTFPVEIIVTNSDEVVKPGMYARVTMNYGSRDNVVVPDRAVVKQMGSGDRYIYVYQQDGTVKFQKVELGRRMSDRYEITAGLADGDEIVVKGQNALNNGVSVERVNE